MNGSKLWQKAYTLNAHIESFTVGEDNRFDERLLCFDCMGTIAHIKLLEKMGHIEKGEAIHLIHALNQIIERSEKGDFTITTSEEDSHTAIENYLIDQCGYAGKKIHLYRSRNDQVLTALRLFCKFEIKQIMDAVQAVSRVVTPLMDQTRAIPMPGFTHSRKAMPSTSSMWAGSIFDAMNDNQSLLRNILHLIDQSPLGTGAGYGFGEKLDREFTADFLGFDRVQENPIYVQNSRGKLEGLMMAVLSTIMLDISRAASDLILFTMPEFGYFSLPDEFFTGSSIMPQKKNPDVFELLRASYHVVTACEFQIKNITAGRISGYHRDVQLTKAPLFKGIDTTKESLSIFSLTLKKLKVNEKQCSEAMTPELFATEKANALVKKGIPFRDAYAQISKEYSG